MRDTLSAFLRERIDTGDFPSAVYLSGFRDGVVAAGAVGKAVIEPEQIGATEDTIYDLASLTKPLVTGLLTAIFIERGTLSLEHKISAHLPEFDTDGKRMITVRDLAAHTSRLPGWVPFYLLADSANIISAITRLDLDFDNDPVKYGDPNFIALGTLLERLSGTSLDNLAEKEIFRPLGLTSTFFNPPASEKPRIAASEFGNEFERRMSIENGYAAAEKYVFRDYWIWGEVHDGNAFFMDGVAGHAGLFSTARDTFVLAQQFMAGTTKLLRPENCRMFSENLITGSNQARSLGFELAASPKSTAGPLLSSKSFGHLGFTGTSLWIDPEAERIYVLLTNRTHRRDLPFPNINAVRRQFHEMASAIESN